MTGSFVTIWNGIDPKQREQRREAEERFVTIWNGIDPKPQIHEFGLFHIENMIHPRGVYSSKHCDKLYQLNTLDNAILMRIS